MKYIRGIDIIETPVIITIEESYKITLSDSQLRELGYRPVEEVIYEQGNELLPIEPNAKEIKEELLKNIKVEIPEAGLPFKLGYKWKPKLVNDRIIFENVKDANAIGTSNNPILFVEYVKLIPNAYYLYEGERYVYVGEPSSATTWEDIEYYMEKF